MPVHAIEGRYRTKEMYALFTEEYKLQKWLDVEVALVKAHAKLGNVPVSIVPDVEKKGNTKIVKLERVQAIEAEINHDVMAMVRGLSEQCTPEAAKYIHLGATSYDIVDTAWAVILKDAFTLVEKRVVDLLKILVGHAARYKHLVCVGRTHGQHAIPTTYGMKFANWADEFSRHLDRLQEIKVRDAVGKFGGAVGNFASHGKNGLKVQALVMETLGIQPNLISTQVVHRDRYAEMIYWTALVASTIAKVAKEIRDLQRSEIAEMFEPFEKEQVGSSTMASKRNPHKSERLCGVYRIIASHVIPLLDDNALIEHERDLTNSSVERILLPENFILLDYMLAQFTSIMKGIEVNEVNIKRNLDLTKGAIMSEEIMVELVKLGMGRQDAHEILRQVAIRCRDEGITYRKGIEDDARIKGKISAKELDRIFDPANYIGLAPELVQGVIDEITKKWLK
ncbi:MAG: adenylosuccinate lyase [Candidatus Lokiarchaeota archaeon]|nr:adenylosuccinate lyase [Candidatus Lokiarchaeota archaeon]